MLYSEFLRYNTRRSDTGEKTPSYKLKLIDMSLSNAHIVVKYLMTKLEKGKPVGDVVESKSNLTTLINDVIERNVTIANTDKLGEIYPERVDYGVFKERNDKNKVIAPIKCRIDAVTGQKKGNCMIELLSLENSPTVMYNVVEVIELVKRGRIYLRNPSALQLYSIFDLSNYKPGQTGIDTRAVRGTFNLY